MYDDIEPDEHNYLLAIELSEGQLFDTEVFNEETVVECFCGDRHRLDELKDGRAIDSPEEHWGGDCTVFYYVCPKCKTELASGV